MRPLLAAAAVVLSVALLGCSSTPEPVGPTSGQADVRVAHLSPTAPAVDVWVDGQRILTSVPYRAISDYLRVPEGPHHVKVTPAGASAPVVIDAVLDLAGGASYTVVAKGLLGTGSFGPLVLSDERQTPTESPRVRFVHVSPDAPAVDVTANNGPFLFRGVAFGQWDGYDTVAPGQYSLQVRPAGQGAIVVDVEGVFFQSRRTYTVFAIGRLSNGSVEALVVEDSL